MLLPSWRKGTEMETDEIEKILAHKLKSTYLGVCKKDELPRTKLGPLAIIANSDRSFQPETHWMAIHVHRDGTGSDDSYGRYQVRSGMGACAGAARRRVHLAKLPLGLRLAIAQTDARPVMPASFRWDLTQP